MKLINAGRKRALERFKNATEQEGRARASGSSRQVTSDLALSEGQDSILKNVQIVRYNYMYYIANLYARRFLLDYVTRAVRSLLIES